MNKLSLHLHWFMPDTDLSIKHGTHLYSARRIDFSLFISDSQTNCESPWRIPVFWVEFVMPYGAFFRLPLSLLSIWCYFFLLRKCDLSWELYGAGLWVRRRGTLIQSIAATAVSWRGASLQRSTRNPTQLKSYHFKNTLYREEQKARDWDEK